MTTIVSETVTRNVRNENVSEAVVRAIAEATETDVEDLPPLYHYVDLDALNRLFEIKIDGSPRSGGRVIFDVGGCKVVVRGTETVEVTSPDAGENPVTYG